MFLSPHLARCRLITHDFIQHDSPEMAPMQKRAVASKTRASQRYKSKSKTKAAEAHPHPHPRSTSTSTSTSTLRVATDVLLSIKPHHLANIISREKNHEYRKYRLKDGVLRLWLYETGSGGGCSSITHIATIPPTTRHEPGSVPDEPAGIGNADFNAGLKESKYGYPILELYKLKHPVTLHEMTTRWSMGGAPMGWQYVGSDLWEDRWGESEERDERVTKLFQDTQEPARCLEYPS
ncbi:hypothetical protein F66182_5257 [Fusarium sp. NRRL 66182]|nr:hypothetical protein F66182_5257 [Fusarium sp. NRRL 66182]